MNLVELIYAYRNFVRTCGKEAAEKYLVSVGASKSIRDELSICVNSEGEFVDFEGNPYYPESVCTCGP